MNWKDNTVVMPIGEMYAAVPVGEAAEQFHGIIRFNETGLFIWNGLIEGLRPEEIAAQLVKEYDGVEMERALKAVQSVKDILSDEGVLAE